MTHPTSSRLIVRAAIAILAAMPPATLAQSLPGWTLYTPLQATDTYLIDEDGTTVHTWPSAYAPGDSVYLLDDGAIMRTAVDSGGSTIASGGAGGRVQRIAWDGTVEWDMPIVSTDFRQHHDIALLPNGNIIALVWELRTGASAVAAGRDPNMIGAEIYSEGVIEIQPTGPDSGQVVWEWHVWDHLVQNHDPDKPDYGEPSDHPERIDINFPPNSSRADWLHCNAIDYNAELDQIVLSCRVFNEIWIISHAPGVSGEILYRWGNPLAYGMGTTDDQKLFSQHDAEWIRPGLPGAGNITIYNNGNNRPAGNFSSAEELVTPILPNGTYSRDPLMPFGPDAPAWICDQAGGAQFYSRFISGTQRLPNGHTLICVGDGGTFLEVDADCNNVWELQNPQNADVFRAERIGSLDPRLWARLWCAADLAEPTDTVTINDLLAFLGGFFAADPAVDIAPPHGTTDVNDLLEFLAAFFAGDCD